MRPNAKSLHAGLLCAVALIVGSPCAGAAASRPSAEPKPTRTLIPGSQLGARAEAAYHGDGLAVIPSSNGARLKCIFQRLEGEATTEGLWLSSTITNTVSDRFRVVATAVGHSSCSSFSSSSSPSTLKKTGIVCLDGQEVRLIRPRLTEEYSVSMDGVRQDFLVPERPQGTGELELWLTINGATVESTALGAQLVLQSSGRKIAYSRLSATDATGRDLSARMEVHGTTVLAIIVNDADALYPIRIDPTFSDANWMSMGGILGTDGTVWAAAADASGSLYIGGDFTIAGEVFVNHVAKWDGSSWSTLGSGMNAHVGALAVSGNDLYAGGWFTMAGDTPANNIARWNGTNWSALGQGVNGSVFALAVSGNDVYAGGDFSTAGGSSASNIARWDSNAWSALGSGVGAGQGVYALAVSGGNVYAGGNFTTAGGTIANCVAMWDGTSWSPLGSGMTNSPGNSFAVKALAVSGTDLYAAGEFAYAGGNDALGIAKWDGSSWSALGPGINGGAVAALAVSGSDLYATGWFTIAGGILANRIAKWDGSSWSALDSGMTGGVVAAALAISGSNIYAGGSFPLAGGIPANNIARWNGSVWSGVGTGALNDTAGAVAVSGNDIYVGGGFTTAGNSASRYVAKWDGSGWSTLGSGMNDGVSALVVSGSALYAGGIFTMAGGITASNIARWDGNAWSALGSGIGGGDMWVRALAAAGSNLYAGGGFTTAGGIPATNIAKWDGNAWSPLGAGTDSPVYALAVLGGDLYVGGHFTTAGGGPANHIAKWNGSSWSPLGSGVGGCQCPYEGVYALAVSGNNLYAGGNFTMAGGRPANLVAKWDGNSWTALGSGIGGGPYADEDRVFALAVSGSDLYAGGYFFTAGGSSANHIAKWNGSSWSPLGSGVADVQYSYQGVRALGLSGSTLYVAGNYTIVGGKMSAHIAKAIVNPPVLAIEPDGFGGYFINLSGIPGSAYRLQRAPTLNGPWSTSGAQTAPASGQLQFWDLFPPLNQAFYRTQQQ